MVKFHLKVYGCQMNVYDADKIRTALIDKGWVETLEDEAEVVIYNGCSIREKAEHKVWSQLGRHSQRWEKDGLPMVAVVGCIAQNVGKEMAERFPWVKLIAGPRHIGFLPDSLENMVRNKEDISMLDDGRTFDDLHIAPLERNNPLKAYVTIAHGCDNFCTYCIVPYVRGRFMSRKPSEILEEIRALVDNGVKEVTLLGQNVNSYGTDFDNGYRFSDLLRDVVSNEGLKLLRFVTSHPKDFTPDIVDVMAEHPSICPAINLPIQSGSERIIKLMNRKYSFEQYANTVDLIRERLPECGLTSDLIVGFPGETEEDFQQSLAAIEKFRYDQVHTAAYSPRKGTVAATMADQVPEEIKKERLAIINDRQSEIALEVNSSLIGKEYTILIDGPAPKGDHLIQGRTPSDKVVIIEADSSLIGSFVRIRITEAEHWCLYGEIIERLDDSAV